jgi:hypothetical protein
MTKAQQAREQAQIARDYAENLRLIQAVVTPPPEVVDLLKTMQQQITDQARTIEAHEARIAVLEARPVADEDGAPRSGIWCTAKEAARRLGYSPSGLRKLAKEGRIVFDLHQGGRRRYDISTVVRSAASVA